MSLNIFLYCASNHVVVLNNTVLEVKFDVLFKF